MDRPTMPGLMWCRAITANRDAKKMIRFPTISRRMASHLKQKKKDFHSFTEHIFSYYLKLEFLYFDNSSISRQSKLLMTVLLNSKCTTLGWQGHFFLKNILAMISCNEFWIQSYGFKNIYCYEYTIKLMKACSHMSSEYNLSLLRSIFFLKTHKSNKDLFLWALNSQFI